MRIPEIPRPEMFQSVPTHRFWGERKPPTNRVDMFSTSVRNAADDDTADASAGGPGGDAPAAGSVATLRMYGPIDSWGGWWGISAKDVSEALDSLGEGVTEIRVRINSPGGEAWEGLAILNMLRAHPARVVAIVDGIAASAASFLAACCDETVMSPGTQLMIHDASGFAFGSAATMGKAKAFLDSTSNSIASLYAEAAGGTDATWRAAMVEETWYTAQEAVEAKLADRVAVVADAGRTSTAGDEPDPAVPDAGDEPVEDRFDLSIYNYAGRSHAPAPQPPTASAGGSITSHERSRPVAFSDEQLITMRQELGLPEDADEATIVAALTEALAEQTQPPPANTIPAGHVVVPEARLTDLETAAALGVSAATQLRTEERDRFLTENRTRYAPANRAAWAAEYDRDPVGTRAHFATAPEIIPTSELGLSGEPTDAIDDSWFPGYATPAGVEG